MAKWKAYYISIHKILTFRITRKPRNLNQKMGTWHDILCSHPKLDKRFSLPTMCFLFLFQDITPDGRTCSILCLNSPDWPLLIFCMLGHICTGLGLPLFARLFGDIFVVCFKSDKTVWSHSSCGNTDSDIKSQVLMMTKCSKDFLGNQTPQYRKSSDF
jgi:hypothetical protein